MIELIVQNFGKRLVFAVCNGGHFKNKLLLQRYHNGKLCDVDHAYVTGKVAPRYPVPAIWYEDAARLIEVMSWDV